MQIHRAGDVTVLSDNAAIPGVGFLPVNQFVLHASEPVVIDTGLSTPDAGFMDALGTVIDPKDVRWIWLTHPDRDHTGGIFELLEAAPEARVITTFAGAGIMTTERPLPMNRVYFLNPGQTMSVGDRNLTAFRPPLYDSPATVGFYDDRSRSMFSSDCFGAALPSAELASGSNVGDVPADAVRGGQLLWATLDSPWVHAVDPGKFRATIEPMRKLDPAAIYSTHLPPITDHLPEMFDMLTVVPGTDPFIGPDQKALEEMLRSFEPVPAG
ncbi:MAG: MBL fold metallo-hydrolase [Mycobacteriales bacterium]